MYREVVQGKKVPAIIVSLFTITIALYIFEAVQLSKVNYKHFDEAVASILIIITTIISIVEFKRCTSSYRYSLIADKLIINKIVKRQDENLESIKIKDIVYIGKRNNMPKEYCKCKNIDNYISTALIENKCYCVYKRQDKYVKFTFAPSEIMLNRLCKNINYNKKDD